MRVLIDVPGTEQITTVAGDFVSPADEFWLSLVDACKTLGKQKGWRINRLAKRLGIRWHHLKAIYASSDSMGKIGRGVLEKIIKRLNRASERAHDDLFLKLEEFRPSKVSPALRHERRKRKRLIKKRRRAEAYFRSPF